MTDDTEQTPTEDDAERTFRALLPPRPPRDIVESAVSADRVEWPEVITDGIFTGIEYVEDADGNPTGIVETTEPLGFRPPDDE